METAVVRLSMPGGVGGQRREPLPTRLETGIPLDISAGPGLCLIAERIAGAMAHK